MRIISTLYLRTQRHKFYRPFRPIGIGKREKFFIAPPGNLKDFLKTLPLIAGMRKLGSIVLFVPEVFLPYIKMFRSNYFQVIYYKEFPRVLTREFGLLKNELNKITFNWLIELNPEANLTLPNLVNAEKRVAFYDKKNFPFYNILFKGGIDALMSFFQIPSVEPLSLFKFNKLELKSILKELPQERPRLFVNMPDKNFGELEKLEWQGGIVYHNKNDEVEKELKKIYLCDAYFGLDDEKYEIARIFKKEIVTI